MGHNIVVPNKSYLILSYVDPAQRSMAGTQYRLLWPSAYTGVYLLVIIDEFSRFPVVEVVRSTSAETVIPVVDNVFSLLGYPEIVKFDNCPPFNEHIWKAFMQENGIRHRKITPLWPQANAQAEAFNTPLMKAIRSARISGASWRREMRKFLRAYRCTSHVTT